MALQPAAIGAARPARTAAATFAMGALCLAAALVLRLFLNGTIGDALPILPAFGATAAAEWFGGRRVAIPVALLAFVGCVLLLPAAGASRLTIVGGALGVAAYLLTVTVIIGFGEATRAAHARAHAHGETLRITFRSIGDAVVTTDVAGRVTSLNAVAEALTGWPQPDAIGQPLDAVFRIVNEETREPVESPAVKALRLGTVVGLANHTLLIHRTGTECPIDDSAAPIRAEDGRISGCVLIFRDVTPQRRLERERASELQAARLAASIIDSSDDAIIRKRLDGTIEMWNSGAERVFGYSAEAAIGRHISLIIPPERISEEERIIATLRDGRRIEHFETERRRADGSRLWVSLTISPIADETGTIIAASKIVRDVTARRLAEAEREKLATVLENSQDFIGMCDLQGIPFFVNRAGLAMVGLNSLDEARGKQVAEFFFPEDRPRIVDEFLPAVLRDGRGEIEVRFRHFRTGEARWMAYKVLVLQDLAGRPTGFATVSQDVTERKALADDLGRLASDLSDADRRKNEFLAMLAHELRNPLAPITNAVRALRARGEGDDQAVQAATEVLERQVAQMARLVNDLLDASRISRGKIELRRARIALRPVVEEAIEAMRPLCTRLEHELTVSLPSEPLYVDGDAGRLAQVIGNLLHNACKFTDKGGRISLSLTCEEGHAVIRVRDNGIGIAAKHLDGLFEMFAQIDTALERSRDGLGIGLALVKTLVELHGGSVDVRSGGPGQGSEFVVRLAAFPAETALPSSRGPVDVRTSEPRRVLVVDDSLDAAQSMVMLLGFEGHDVHEAHDGAEAIRVAERVRPDVVLMDIGLPIMNGYEACRHIRSQPWGQTMLLVAMTGWGQDEDRERSSEAGFDVHLVKPVDHDELFGIIAGARRRTSPTPPAALP
jgi:PAS domain S-box-containing protein